MRISGSSFWAAILLGFSFCVWGQETKAPSTPPPTSADEQMADLKRRAQPADSLGVTLKGAGGENGLELCTEISVPKTIKTVTVPLMEVATRNLTEPGGRYRWPVVLANINGTKSVPLLLDTGASYPVLGYTLARRLNLPIIGGVNAFPITGGRGKANVHPAVVSLVDVGDLRIEKLLALVGADASFPKHMIGGQLGKEGAMIMGLYAWKGISYLCIDSLRGTATFSLYEPYQRDPTVTFVTSVPMRWESDKLSIEIAFDDRHTHRCLIDTGGDFDIYLPQKVSEAMGYRMAGDGKAYTGRGVGGVKQSRLYELKKVKIGEAALTGVPAVSDLGETRLSEVLLGNKILRRYRVTYDFRNEKLWLER